jgi:hypothetical protein
MAGYSKTSLAKKLGIEEGSRVFVVDAPKNYRALLEPLPASVKFVSKLGASIHIVHVFVTKKSELARALARYRKAIDPDAMVWVSWPKKSANVPTDVTEGVVREIALPLGFVDVKVCAVDDTWSGLKLVIRRELR